MAGQVSVFPAFVKAQYDSSGQAFAAFERDGKKAADQVQRHFKGSMDAIAQLTKQALSRPLNDVGALNLDVASYRQAAVAAQQKAMALRQVANAADQLAAREKNLTGAQQVYVQQARAAAAAADQEAMTARERVAIYDQLQRELNETARATAGVATANRQMILMNRQGAEATRSHRTAQLQLGQQLQDTVISLQAGMNPLTVFMQQGSQAAFVAANMGGSLGRVAAFLSGPWGSALFLGAAAVGVLVTKLGEAETAAKNAELGASGLSEAQSVLGEMFDLTSGKLEHQNELLRLNARLTAINLRADAMKESADARKTFGQVGETGALTRWLDEDVQTALTPDLRARAGAQKDLYARLLMGPKNGGVSIEQALRETEKMDFSGLRLSKQEFQKALVDTVSAAFKKDLAERLDKSVTTGVLDPALRSDGRTRKPRDRTAELQRLEEFGQSAGNTIEEIAARYAGQSRPFLQAAKDINNLDELITKLGHRKPPNFDALIASAEKAKIVVGDGLLRQMREGFEEQPGLIGRIKDALADLDATAADYEKRKPPGWEAFVDRLRATQDAIAQTAAKPLEDRLRAMDRETHIQDALLAGREEEATILRETFSLMDQLGAKSQEQLDDALAKAGVEGTVNDILAQRVKLMREQERAGEILREKQQAYLNAIADTRSLIQRTVEDMGSRGFKSVGDLASGFGGIFRRLNAEVMTEKLFGDIFRDLDQAVKSPLQKAEDRMATSMDGGSSAVDTFASATEAAAARIQAAAGAVGPVPTGRLTGLLDGLGGDPARVTGLGSPTGLLPVIGAITGSFAEHLRRNSAGLDIDAKMGDSIRAPAGGRVAGIGYNDRAGNWLKLDHGAGIETSYSHLAQLPDLMKNAIVSAGQVIARVGNTGNARSSGGGDGSHLHYRVKVGGRDVDPQGFRFPETVDAAAAGLNSIAEAASTAAEHIGDAGDGFLSVARAVASLPGFGTGTPTGALDGLMEQISSLAETEQDFIEVIGRRPKEGEQLNPVQLMNLAGAAFGAKVGQLFGGSVGKEIGRQIGAHLGDALQGAQFGQMAGGLVLGNRNSQLGSSIGGALGNVAGKELGKMFGKQLGKLAEFAGPVGSILGGLAGGLIGKMLTKPKYGTAGLTLTSGGELAGTAGSGRGSAQISAATGLSKSVAKSINAIAEQFGATIGGLPNITMGVYKDKYRVSTTGYTGGPLNFKGKSAVGLKDFGQDQQAAITFAIQYAISKSVISGIRQGTANLIKSGDDLELAIQKALKFESVFTRLKEMTNPVGAAIDAVEKEFAQLRKIFAEAGATAAEMADLEQLYGLERTRAVKEAGQAMTSTLKGLLDDLTVNNDARSLRDRLTDAKAKYDPLKADFAAGKKVDPDAFAEATRNVEAIMREFGGSQTPYFEFLNEATDITKQMLAEQQKLIDNVTNPAPGAPAGAANDNTSSAVDRMHGGLGGKLDAVNTNLGAILKAVGSGPATLTGGRGGVGGGDPREPGAGLYNHRQNF